MGDCANRHLEWYVNPSLQGARSRHSPNEPRREDLMTGGRVVVAPGGCEPCRTQAEEPAATQNEAAGHQHRLSLHDALRARRTLRRCEGQPGTPWLRSQVVADADNELWCQLPPRWTRSLDGNSLLTAPSSRAARRGCRSGGADSSCRGGRATRAASNRSSSHPRGRCNATTIAHRS